MSMQMIDVLKRLAEIDSNNPRVDQTMTQEQSLATVTNIEGKQLNESLAECGPMGMMGGMNTPASFSINASAGSGDEVASMLTQIMNLAGVKPVSELPAFGGGHPEIEIEPAHSAEVEPHQSAGDEMGGLIGMIDRMNGHDDGEESEEVGPESLGPEQGESDSPVADMADEVRGMADEMSSLKDEGIGAGFDSATTTPDEKVHSHKYGNDQVTIGKKAEPEKKAGAGNPYTEATIESVKTQLLKDYQAFVAEGEKKTMSRAAKGYEKYGKEGMKALAKAGKDGKDLDKVRNKYDKYN
jgi:hypothetical protein